MTEILIFKLIPIENDYFTWYCVIAEHEYMIISWVQVQVQVLNLQMYSSTSTSTCQCTRVQVQAHL